MTSKTENSQTTTYSYDYDNHMTGITFPDQSTNSFGYYGTGQRAWKVDSAGTSRFVYDGDEYGAPILAEVGGGGDYIASYTHGVQGLISQRRGSTTNWYHYDDLGSTRNLTNSSQTTTDAYTYKAFGEIPASSGSTTNPFRYIGSLNYYRDADSTLLLLGARYYSPQSGRFTTVDPLAVGNLYGYAENRPGGLSDPSGLWGGTRCATELSRVLKWLKSMCHSLNDLGRRWYVKEACDEALAAMSVIARECDQFFNSTANPGFFNAACLALEAMECCVNAFNWNTDKVYKDKLSEWYWSCASTFNLSGACQTACGALDRPGGTSVPVPKKVPPRRPPPTSTRPGGAGLCG